MHVERAQGWQQGTAGRQGSRRGAGAAGRTSAQRSMGRSPMHGTPAAACRGRGGRAGDTRTSALLLRRPLWIVQC